MTMLLDLTRLHGAREHFERSLPAAVFDPPDEDYRVMAPVEVSMDVVKGRGDSFDVTGEVRTTLEMACSRCVEPFEVPIDAAFELRYLPAAANAGEGEREIEEEDLATAFYRDGAIDLVEMLREQFQLALPMKPLHDEACRGLCPVCGANLNRADCGHPPTWEDPRLAPLRGLLRSKEQ
jgi:uncharacterized protein